MAAQAPAAQSACESRSTPAGTGSSWSTSATAAGALAGIPGVLIHGRNDLGGGVITAWELARAWPGAQLIVIEDSGHTGSASMQEALRLARDRLFTSITGRG